MSTTVSVCACECQIRVSVSINLNAEFEFGYLPLDIQISVRSMAMAFPVNPTDSRCMYQINVNMIANIKSIVSMSLSVSPRESASNGIILSLSTDNRSEYTSVSIIVTTSEKRIGM